MNRNRYSWRPLSLSLTDSGIALVLCQMLSMRRIQAASIIARAMRQGRPSRLLYGAKPVVLTCLATLAAWSCPRWRLKDGPPLAFPE